MLGLRISRQLLVALPLVLLLPSGGHSQSSGTAPHDASKTGTTTYHYTIEWRLITAGAATLKVTHGGTPEYPSIHSELDLESAGIVSRLYKVEDKYFGNYEPNLCAISSQMSAVEGRRRRETRITYDRTRNKASYMERDLVKNTTQTAETDIPHCVHDVVSGLMLLPRLNLEVGKSTEIAMSDGKKAVQARIEAQEREDVKINDKTYKAIRYEAFLFNNVLYARKARLFIWLTDDARRLPVQIRLRMNFPVGTVTLSLEKVEQT